MRARTISITFLVFFLSIPVQIQAKDFWLKESYQKWSQRDCQRMLQDSPWAREYAIGGNVIELFDTQRTDRGREANPRILYYVRFTSALPVRQAEVRLAQLQTGYDQLSQKQKNSFDQQAQPYLNASFDDRVTVHVSFGSNIPTYDRELLQYWQNLTLAQVENTTYLIGADGTRVKPTGFQMGQPGRNEFVLVFPRQPEGKPLVGPGDKRLSVEFEHPDVGQSGRQRVFVEFSVKKMTIDGDVIY